MFGTSLTRITTIGATSASHTGPAIAPHGARSRSHSDRMRTQEHIMTRNSKSVFAAFLIAASTLLVVPAARAGEPGIRHTVFMAGSVIGASADGIYLCIGTADGAEPGQVLNVVRVTRDRRVNPKQGVRIHRERVGTVRVGTIVDQHFAQATILDGKVEKGDIVRLGDSDESMKTERRARSAAHGRRAAPRS